MALRLVKMVCPAERREEVDELLGEYEPIALWYEELLGEDLLVCIVLPAEMAEDVLDDLEDRFGSEEGFHIIVVAVEAVVPQPELEEEGGPEKEEAEKGRLSRQELYEDISGSAQLNWTYVSMILLAALIAGIGIWLDNVAVIIGAMVIAPMLDPNMALGLACALGDGELLWRALRTNLAGIGAALALSVVVGAVLGRVQPAQQTFWGTGVNLYHVIIALAAGGAGALAVTRATRSALVGVMVAVALVPPLVALGLAVGSARWPEALGGALLFLANLVCINLAAVAVFMLHGIRPHRFYEAEEARKAARRAIVLWLVLLALMVVGIWLAQGHLQAAGPGN